MTASATSFMDSDLNRPDSNKRLIRGILSRIKPIVAGMVIKMTSFRDVWMSLMNSSWF